MKTCSKCGIPKDEAEFSVDRSRKDGKTPSCKECQKNYYTENRDGIRAKQETYRSENTEGLAATHKGYHAKNRERILAYQKVYRNKNRERISARNKAYHAENREEILANQKAHYTKNRKEILARERDSKHGLAPGEFDRLFSEQGGVCAICEVPGRKLCVDHDHSTGKVRALLCGKCNLAIGQLGDSSERALATSKYLKSHGK